MSWRYAAPVIWTCDRCEMTAPGSHGVPPDGWVARYEWKPAADHMPTRYECHHCPDCAPPEQTK